MRPRVGWLMAPIAVAGVLVTACASVVSPAPSRGGGLVLPPIGAASSSTSPSGSSAVALRVGADWMTYQCATRRCYFRMGVKGPIYSPS